MRKSERKNRWFSVVLGALVFVLGIGSNAIKSEAFNGESTISFYLLDSSMEIPDEPSSNPKQNYTADGVTGTLYAEIANQVTTDRATWIVDGVYGNNVASMLVKHPAASELGVTQDEYNKVYWYVIKREVDGLHVDGVVMNRQYNVVINYGYLDENNNFVKFDSTIAATKNLKVNFNDLVTETTVLEGYDRVSPDISMNIVRDTEINVVYSQRNTDTEEEVSTVAKVMYRYFLGELKATPDYPITVGNIDKSYLESAEKLNGFVNALDGSVLNMHRPIVNYHPGEVVKVEVKGDFVTVDILYRLVVTQDTGNNTNEVELIIPSNNDVTNDTLNDTNTEDVGIVVLQDVVEEVTQDEQEPETEEVQEENPDEGVIVLDDNAVPLDGSKGGDELAELDDSLVPLAVPYECVIHWMLLALMGLYAVYQVIAIARRQKEIKNLTKMA